MKKIFVRILKNKYLIVCLVFLFFFFLIDDNSILFSFKLNKQLKDMETQKAFYQEEIEQDSINTIKLQTNLAEIECHGREEYFMKRANEDVYIIQKNKE